MPKIFNNFLGKNSKQSLSGAWKRPEIQDVIPWAYTFVTGSVYLPACPFPSSCLMKPNLSGASSWTGYIIRHKAVSPLRELILWEVVTRSRQWVRITGLLMVRGLFGHQPTGLDWTLNKSNNHIPKTPITVVKVVPCCQPDPRNNAQLRMKFLLLGELTNSCAVASVLPWPDCSSLSCSGRCLRLPELSNAATFKQQNSLEK